MKLPVRKTGYTVSGNFTIAGWSLLKQVLLEEKKQNRKTETVTDPKAQNGSDLFTSQFNKTK